MRHVLAALAWEYWREHRFWLTSLFIGAFVLGVVPLGEKPTLSFSQECSTQYVILLIEFVGITWFIVRSHFDEGNARLGFPEGLYVTPVGTSVLVSWRLVLISATAAMVHATTVGLLFAILRWRWPLVGPILFISMVLCISLAVIWLTANLKHVQMILGGVLALGFFVLYNTIFHVDRLLLGRPTSMWSANQSSTYLMMLAVTLLALGVSIRGVIADRRGNLAWSAWTQTAASGLLPFRRRSRSAVHKHPQNAMFWLYWHRIGWVFPGINLAIVVACMAICSSGFLRSDVAVGLSLVMALANLIVMPFLLGFVSGPLSTRTWEMSLFEATHPVTNRTMLLARFKCVFSALVSAWAVLLAGLYLIDALLQLQGQRPIVPALRHGLLETLVSVLSGAPPADAGDGIFVLGAVYFLLAWSAMGLTMSVALTGRKKLVIGLSLFAGLALALGIALIKTILPDVSVPAMFRQGALYAVSAGSMIGTIILFSCAYRKRWIRFNTLLASFVTYVFMGAVSLLILRHLYLPTLRWHFLTLGFLALPIAPFAAAPLAMAYNRHR